MPPAKPRIASTWLAGAKSSLSSSRSSAATRCESRSYSASPRISSSKAGMSARVAARIVSGSGIEFSGRLSRLAVCGLDGLGEAEHCRRVEARAVIAREHVEVLQADEVLARLAGRGELDEDARYVGADALVEDDVRFAQLLGAVDRFHAAVDEQLVAFPRDGRRHGDRRAGEPAVRVQEVRDAADRVGRARAEVAASVAVEVDREAADAPRHELRDADRARVRAAEARRIGARLARVEQERLELGAEELGAARVVECERGERVEHAEGAGLATVLGLDADDGHDDLGRYAVRGGRAREHPRVATPELHAGVDAARAHEAVAVAAPRALAAGNRGHQRHDGVEIARLREDLVELALAEPVSADHLGHEAADLRPFDVPLGGGGAAERGEQRARRAEARDQGHTRNSRTRCRSRATSAGSGAGP